MAIAGACDHLKTRRRAAYGSRKCMRSEGGQAIVEYLLILVVTVAIITGLVYSFSDQFRRYADALLGDYVICLLEVGELPGLGGDGGISGECQAPRFNASAVDAGSNDFGSGTGGSGTGAGSGRNGSSASSSQSNASGGSRSGKADENGSKNADGAGASGGGGAGGRGGGDPFGDAGRGRPRARRIASSGDGEPASTSSTGKMDLVSRANGGGDRRETARPGRGGVIVSQMAISDQDADGVDRGKKVPLGKVAERAGRKARMLLDRRPAAKKTSGEEVIEFSIGNLLRWILLIGILIAIVLFVGGQVMQAAKSWDKAE